MNPLLILALLTLGKKKTVTSNPGNPGNPGNTVVRDDYLDRL